MNNNNNITVKFLYKVNQRVFNVGKEGITKNYDPLNKVSYHYASPANIKHNFINRCYELMQTNKPIKIYSKNSDELKRDNEEVSKGGQDCVFNEIDYNNNIITISGAWNPIALDDDKYNQSQFKASIEFGSLLPISSKLSKINTTIGVNVGDSTSKIIYKKDKKYIDNPEDLAKLKIPNFEEVKDAEKAFNGLKMNLVPSIETASGLYSYTVVIRISKVGKFLKDGIKDNDKIKALLENGWKEQKIGGYIYLVPSKETIEKTVKTMVEALFTWDFSSNNSCYGEPIKLLRVAFGKNCAQYVHYAIQTKRVDGEDYLKLYDSNEVSTFNTPLLEEVYDVDKNNIKTDIDAIKNAESELTKLCLKTATDDYDIN